MPLNLKWTRGKPVIDETGGVQASSWETTAIEGKLIARIVRLHVVMPNKWICHVSYQGHVYKFENANNLKESKEAVGEFIRKQGH